MLLSVAVFIQVKMKDLAGRSGANTQTTNSWALEAKHTNYV
jgi:hypothetical protein